MFLAALLLASSALAGGDSLETAGQIRALSAEEARRAHPVHVRGIVTNLSGWKNSFFFQDETSGISVDRRDNTAVRPGDEVEIDGESAPGLFAPVIISNSVRVVGHRSLPPAALRTYTQLVGGQQDAQRIAVRGIVRSAFVAESWGRQVLFLNLDLGTGFIEARVHDFPAGDPAALVDAEVTAEGVCGTNFNDKRQYVSLRLFVNDLSDVRIDLPAPKNPFGIPGQPIGSILQFSTLTVPRHRVKVEGTVTYQRPGRLLCIQNGGDGIYVESRQTTPVSPGARVEAAGFASAGQYSPVLQSAVFHVVGHGAQPPAVALAAGRVIRQSANFFPNAPYDALLVRVRGTLIETVRGAGDVVLVLRDQDTLFRARLDDPRGLKALANGSLLEVTGVCGVRTDESRQPRSFEIEMRTPADVALLHAPPWWNLRHAFQVLAALILCVLAAMAWGWGLQRRVRAQTRVIRLAQEQLREALAKEQEVSRLDFLTGLKNRRAFYEEGENELRRARRYRRPLSLAYIDIDHFKAVNDSLGHEEGDRLLTTVANVIRGHLRATDVIARLGGDEFAVLLPETGPAAARTVLEKLRTALLATAQEQLWPVTFSIGTIVCELPPQSFDHLVRDADQVMYMVKKSGKNSLTLQER